MRLTNLHSLASLQNEVQQICQKFFEAHKINFFGYTRTHSNKTSFWLSSHPEVYEYLLDHRLPLNSPVSTELVKPFFYYSVPWDGAYSKAMHDIATRFNLFNPLDIFFQHEGYYELFCFGIEQNNNDIINYYMNNLLQFKLFCLDFRTEASELIQQAESNHLLLPDDMYLPVKNLILPKPEQFVLKNMPVRLTSTMITSAIESNKTFNDKKSQTFKKYLLNYGDENIKLSKREFECLVCLLQGKSARISADELCLSRRTVEAYLDTIKQKTLSNSKLELVTKIYRSIKTPDEFTI